MMEIPWLVTFLALAKDSNQIFFQVMFKRDKTAEVAEKGMINRTHRVDVMHSHIYTAQNPILHIKT
jgi:hypothetical protein